MWIIQEFARTRQEHERLLVAFCLGAFVPMVDVLNNYRLGVAVGGLDERYSSSGTLFINADHIALILVIGIPIALYQMRHGGAMVRFMGIVYVLLGSVAVLLTATRSAFLAAVVGLSIAPFTQLTHLLRSSFRISVLLRATVLVAVVSATSALIVPASIWNRMSTIQSELIEGGRLGGRSEIWSQGLQLFWDRPLLGFGVAAFPYAIAPLRGGEPEAPHNIFLEVLIEQGVVGLCIFVALLGAVGWTISRLPSPERKLWAALMLSWLVGVMAINFGSNKVTWLLFGLLAAQTAETRRRHIPQATQQREYMATRRFLTPLHSAHVVRTSRG
jgi:O-antigen ligase